MHILLVARQLCHTLRQHCCLAFGHSHHGHGVHACRRARGVQLLRHHVWCEASWPLWRGQRLVRLGMGHRACHGVLLLLLLLLVHSCIAPCRRDATWRARHVTPRCTGDHRFRDSFFWCIFVYPFSVLFCGVFPFPTQCVCLTPLQPTLPLSHSCTAERATHIQTIFSLQNYVQNKTRHRDNRDTLQAIRPLPLRATARPRDEDTLHSQYDMKTSAQPR